MGVRCGVPFAEPVLLIEVPEGQSTVNLLHPRHALISASTGRGEDMLPSAGRGEDVLPSAGRGEGVLPSAGRGEGVLSAGWQSVWAARGSVHQDGVLSGRSSREGKRDGATAQPP